MLFFYSLTHSFHLFSFVLSLNYTLLSFRPFVSSFKMYFSKAVVLSFAVSALALPTLSTKPHKRAGVLTATTYDNFQVSDGVAGNALAEVKAKFPVS